MGINFRCIYFSPSLKLNTKIILETDLPHASGNGLFRQELLIIFPVKFPVVCGNVRCGRARYLVKGMKMLTNQTPESVSSQGNAILSLLHSALKGMTLSILFWLGRLKAMC